MRYHVNMKKNHPATKHHELPLTLLGQLTPRQFMAEYWQKKPLLVRGAMPGFTGLLDADELAGLACEEDSQARLVMETKAGWQLEQGPFEAKRFSKLPEKNWTLLVQGLNHHLPEGRDLLRQFDFIPQARLDDLMVSYAPDGGGVGPHFDSYDVFLLQGPGRRIWRISEQQDLTLVNGAPLRILQNFHTQQEWTLEAGDMLYLPPHVAHWGIAQGDCMTYSIGFRAPSAQELGTEFLSFLQEKCVLAGMYQDPALEPQRHPAKIGAAMLDQVVSMLSGIKWTRADVAQFLGQYLSEPKPHVVFDPPRAISLAAFTKRLEKGGISLSLKSQMLFHHHQYFMNGEMVSLPNVSQSIMRKLADTKCISPGTDTDTITVQQLHEWYLAGYLEF